MPDYPLLTPEARNRVYDAMDATFPTSAQGRWLGEAIDAGLPAFLAAHNPEALAERFAREEKLDLIDQVIVKRAYGWLGLGGDDD